MTTPNNTPVTVSGTEETVSGGGHTPGPWVVERIDYSRGLDVSFEVRSGERGDGVYKVIASTHMIELEYERFWRVDEANARLIAASPTMAEYISRRSAEGDPEATKIMETINARG